MMTATSNPNTVANSSKLADQTDEQLLLDYRASGSRSAFDELVHRYERELFSYLRRYLNDAELAEDAFQGAFLQVHLKGDQFQEGRKFRPWLYTIATNQAIDIQRKNKRHRMVSLDSGGRSEGNEDLDALVNIMTGAEEDPCDQLEGQERSEWVQNAVAELAEPLRAVVTMVYYQGLKYREAAEALEIPVGTVKSRLHSALLKLNEAWLSSNADPS